MQIKVKVIKHKFQRYPTVGDWFFIKEGPESGDVLHIRVSNMGNEDYENLVIVHEIIEAILCKKRNISEDSVTDFDLKFESERENGNEDEPGNNPNAPYHKEHVFATKIERQIADELGVDWDEYDKAVNSL